MKIENFKRARFIIETLLPCVEELTDLSLSKDVSERILGESIFDLCTRDETFKSDFDKLLLETKNRLEKEFNDM